MTVENIFEYATRNKVSFPYKGNVWVEDLWDLSVTELDKVFKTLNSQRKQSQEESLLNTKSKEDEIVDVQIAIVKHIVAQHHAELSMESEPGKGTKICILFSGAESVE